MGHQAALRETGHARWIDRAPKGGAVVEAMGQNAGRKMHRQSGFHFSDGERSVLQNSWGYNGRAGGPELCRHNAGAITKSGHSQRRACEKGSTAALSLAQGVRADAEEENLCGSARGGRLRRESRLSVLRIGDSEVIERGVRPDGSGCDTLTFNLCSQYVYPANVGPVELFDEVRQRFGYRDWYSCLGAGRGGRHGGEEGKRLMGAVGSVVLMAAVFWASAAIASNYFGG